MYDNRQTTDNKETSSGGISAAVVVCGSRSVRRMFHVKQTT
ncbi:hypothetical protein [Ruminococcus callidus]